MRPEALALAPASARASGAEIRVIGNDAGEKLSILAGTLARLDRDAPSYGPGNYSDFNTFYIQAASGTSGGSSGSPVVDRAGRVVALVRGRQPQRGVELLPAARPRRGRALALAARRPAGARAGRSRRCSSSQSFDELGRLGLSRETEARVRGAHPARARPAGGEGGAAGRPGGRACSSRATCCSRSRGARCSTSRSSRRRSTTRSAGAVRARASSARASAATLAVPVQDLHAVTPAAYLELAGGVLHPLSLQQARNYGVPVAGVLRRRRAGYAFARAGMPAGARRDPRARRRRPSPDLDALERELAEAAATARALPRALVRDLDAARAARSVSVLRVDRRWFATRRCVRDDAAGRLAVPRRSRRRPPPPAPRSGDRSARPAPARPERALAHSLVCVGLRRALRDRRRARRAPSRARASSWTPSAASWSSTATPCRSRSATCEITFARLARACRAAWSRSIPSTTSRSCAYDPAQLGETPVESAELRAEPLAPRRRRLARRLDAAQRLVSRRDGGRARRGAAVPLPERRASARRTSSWSFPTETLTRVGGVLADGKGRVRALWSSISREGAAAPTSFFAGIPADLVERHGSRRFAAASALRWRTLGVELGTVPLADARRARPRARRRPASSRRTRPGRRRVARGAARRCRQRPRPRCSSAGDLLLASNGRAVTRFREVERAAQRERVALDRRATAQPSATLDVATAGVRRDGTREALLWAGALLQPPPSSRAGPARRAAGGRLRGGPLVRHAGRAPRPARRRCASSRPAARRRPISTRSSPRVRGGPRPRLRAAPRRGSRRAARGRDARPRPPLLADAGATVSAGGWAVEPAANGASLSAVEPAPGGAALGALEPR